MGYLFNISCQLAYMLDFYKITRFEIPKMSPPSFWWSKYVSQIQSY